MNFKRPVLLNNLEITLKFESYCNYFCDQTNNQSSAQAEIYAMLEAFKDIRLRLWVADELGLQPTYPTDVKVDNQAGVYFQNKMNPATKLKGVFDLRQKWVKELQDRRIITAVKVNTNVNLADQLTKPLSGRKLMQLDQCLESHRKVLEMEKQIR